MIRSARGNTVSRDTLGNKPFSRIQTQNSCAEAFQCPLQ